MFEPDAAQFGSFHARRGRKGQAHHMFSPFLNLQFFSLNFLCFVFLQGRSFLLRSKMPIQLFIISEKRHFAAF